MSVSPTPEPPRRFPAHPVTLLDALIFAGGLLVAALIGFAMAAPPL